MSKTIYIIAAMVCISYVPGLLEKYTEITVPTVPGVRILFGVILLTLVIKAAYEKWFKPQEDKS